MTDVSATDRPPESRSPGTLSMLRIGDWYHFLPLPLLTFERSVLDGTGNWTGWVLAVIAAATSLGFAYAWNEHIDRRVQQGLDARGWSTLPTGLRVALILLFVGTLALVSLNGTRAIVAAVIALVAGALYSGGPRLKALPVIGSLTNIAIFGPLLFFGPDLPLSNTNIFLITAFCAILLQNQLIHEASHAKEDAADHIRTSWLVLGPRVTTISATILGIVGVLMLWLASPSLWSVLASIPLLMLSISIAIRITQLTSPEPARRLRYIQRIMGLVAGSVTWLFTI